MKLRIVKGSIGSAGKASNAELGEAVAWCDFPAARFGPLVGCAQRCGRIREAHGQALRRIRHYLRRGRGRTAVADKLPEDVRKSVVWHEQFWLTAEALSTYMRSAGLFGLEMHSPIMCIGNGVPVIVCRFAEQTSKGFMWRDIGLGEWLFDFDDETDLARLPGAVAQMVKQPAATREKVIKAQAFVAACQRDTMAVVKRSLAA